MHVYCSSCLVPKDTKDIGIVHVPVLRQQASQAEARLQCQVVCTQRDMTEQACSCIWRVLHQQCLLENLVAQLATTASGLVDVCEELSVLKQIGEPRRLLPGDARQRLQQLQQVATPSSNHEATKASRAIADTDRSIHLEASRHLGPKWLRSEHQCWHRAWTIETQKYIKLDYLLG